MNQKETAADWFATAFVKALDQYVSIRLKGFPLSDPLTVECRDIVESIVANMMRSAYGVSLRLQSDEVTK